MVPLSPAVVRLAALAVCAALLLIEHMRLALGAARVEGALRGALALVLPGLGAVMAWRRGARAGPIAYVVLTLAYLLLLLVP